MKRKGPAAPRAKRRWGEKTRRRWARGRKLFFSTHDARGRAGGVPVWFNFHDGVLYLVSMKDSVKVSKIHNNPRVHLRVLEGPPGELDGVAETVEDERLEWALFRKKNEKYGHFYGATTRETCRKLMAERVLIAVRPVAKAS